MVITLLLSSLLGSVIGTGLGLYWGLGAVMIGTFYILGGMIAVTCVLMALLSREKKRETPHLKPAPQFSN
ncbi:MAG: hypothetical protein AAGF33_00035 [Pseudomonadota bacterium]